MGDSGDYFRDRKKKSNRVFRKPDRELETFMPDSMRSPGVQVLGKSALGPKINNIDSYDSSHGDWESGKRGRGNYHEKRGSYHNDKHIYSEWPKKSHMSEWEKKNNHIEWDKHGSYNSQGLADSGRPPGPKESSVVTPVILSRVKTPNEVKTSNNVTIKKDTDSNNGSTATPQKPQSSKFTPLEATASVVPEQQMKRPQKMFDDTFNEGDDLTPFLLDQTHFMVVAVVGTQGTGKSTLASLIADPKLNLVLPRSYVFKIETYDQILLGGHSTRGIDVFVTKDRLIILDFQPLLSPSIMDNAIIQDKKGTMEKKAHQEYGSLENLMEVESLQLLTFAMSVAHAVLVVQNYTMDPNITRLLHICEMMKPAQGGRSMDGGLMSSSRGNPSGDPLLMHQSFPHIIFVHNRALKHHFTPSVIKPIQNSYHQSFSGSYLEKESRVGSCNGFFPQLSNASCGQLLNMFVIPEFSHNRERKRRWKEDCDFMKAVKDLRRQLVGIKRVPLSHVTLTEKSWYQYACRMWESVRNSSLCYEYCRHLP